MLGENQLGLAAKAQIYRWAYRLLQNHHDALDATQEVMLRWLSRPAGEVVHQQAWLRRTTANFCVDLIRRRRPSGSPGAEAAHDDTPCKAVAQVELQERVRAGLARLSTQQRAVVIAKVLDQETFAEAAASLGISPGAAKTHYVRALRKLRQVLRGFGQTEE